MIIMAGYLDLFSQYQMGDFTLPNRIIMAPMTRSRTGYADIPVSLMATYYVQRVSAGDDYHRGLTGQPSGVWASCIRQAYTLQHKLLAGRR